MENTKFEDVDPNRDKNNPGPNPRVKLSELRQKALDTKFKKLKAARDLAPAQDEQRSRIETQYEVLMDIPRGTQDFIHAQSQFAEALEPLYKSIQAAREELDQAISIALGKTIREIRNQEKITLEDMAVLTDSDVGNLSRMERGKQEIKMDMLRSISQVLDHNPWEIYHVALRQVSAEQKGRFMLVLDPPFSSARGPDNGISSDETRLLLSFRQLTKDDQDEVRQNIHAKVQLASEQKDRREAEAKLNKYGPELLKDPRVIALLNEYEQSNKR